MLRAACTEAGVSAHCTHNHEVCFTASLFSACVCVCVSLSTLLPALAVACMQADNGRLVALLSSVPQFQALASEVAAEGGLHYLPLEECLMLTGHTEDVYQPLADRPVGQSSTGTGRSKDSASHNRMAAKGNASTTVVMHNGLPGPFGRESSGNGGGEEMDGYPTSGELRAVLQGEAAHWVPRQVRLDHHLDIKMIIMTQW